MLRITCQSLTEENFSRFGQVIDAVGRSPDFINDGTTQRFPDLATFDSGGQISGPTIGIYLANARSFPLRITRLERHLQANQVFIPMGMHRFVVVVAPGGETPDWVEIAAFVTSSGQGVSLHRGTWHHGLVALSDADRFAVIEGKNYRMDTEEKMATQELWLDGPILPSTAPSFKGLPAQAE